MTTRNAPVSAPHQKCFACGKELKAGVPLRLVDTRDDQIVGVGPTCYRRVTEAGEDGFQPSEGPRLYPLSLEH